MDFEKLARHIANFFLGFWKLMEEIKTWATEGSKALKD